MKMMSERRSYLEEKLKQVNVVWFFTEMFFQQVVNSSFKHERIVDSDITNSRLTSHSVG